MFKIAVANRKDYGKESPDCVWIDLHVHGGEADIREVMEKIGVKPDEFGDYPWNHYFICGSENNFGINIYEDDSIEDMDEISHLLMNVDSDLLKFIHNKYFYDKEERWLFPAIDFYQEHKYASFKERDKKTAARMAAYLLGYTHDTAKWSKYIDWVKYLEDKNMMPEEYKPGWWFVDFEG